MRAKVAVALVAVVALLAAGIVGALFFGHVLTPAKPADSSAQLAPDFTLPNIYGQNFTLSHYRNNAVVVIEFTSLSCSECQIVEQSLKSLTTTYNQTPTGDVQMISIYIEPQFGDTVPALKSYQEKNDITWTMAQDAPIRPGQTASAAYGVLAIPTVITVDKQGHAVYDVSGAQKTSDLQGAISGALAGTSAPITIITVSVFALAVIAGITVFFSPCAFPMFPGYMSLFLGLNTASKETQSQSGGTYKGAARRALFAGSVSSLGMMLVFLLIGLLLVVAANAVSKYIPYLLVAVGVALIALGALLLTNLQYWRIVTPFQRLGARLRGRGPDDAVAVTPVSGEKGFYLKLFGYGAGYAAAAAGCVAPVVFSVMFAGLALGLLNGLVVMLIFSLTAAVLMIVVTLMLAVAGKKYVNLLKQYTPLIKKVSAVALLVVGVYLVYFYYTAWVGTLWPL